MRCSARFCALLWIVALTLSSCARERGYLHYYEPQTAGGRAAVRLKLTNGLADVVISIDHNMAMTPVTAQVTEGMRDFFASVSANPLLHWKLALTSGDPNDGDTLGWSRAFDWRSANASQEFNSGVKRLNDFRWSGAVEPMKTLFGMFRNYSGALIRAGAPLHVLILANKDDETGDPAAFVSQLISFKGDRDIHLHGVFGASDLGCPQAGWKYAGSHLERAIVALGGRAYPLCQSDYGQAIAREITVNSLPDEIALPTLPRLGTLKVMYHGRELAGGDASQGGKWRYDFDRNVVLLVSHDFVDPLDPGEVEVSYELR